MNIFKKKTSAKDALRTSKREMSVATRGVEREIAALQLEEKKLVAEIKKTAKTGNECKILGNNVLSSQVIMEGLKESNANLVVYVHPSKANNVHEAVLRQLSTSLFTFDEVFDGILLAYSFEILNMTAKILPGLIPYIGVKINAKLLVLSPKAGMLLEGKVAKLGKESIHVVILGVCAAAITSEVIREELVYKIKDGSGVFASKIDKRHVIKMGTMVRFLVKGLDEELLHLSGSLIPENTGSVRWLSNHYTTS